MVKDFANQLT